MYITVFQILQISRFLFKSKQIYVTAHVNCFIQKVRFSGKIMLIALINSSSYKLIFILVGWGLYRLLLCMRVHCMHLVMDMNILGCILGSGICFVKIFVLAVTPWINLRFPYISWIDISNVVHCVYSKEKSTYRGNVWWLICSIIHIHL